MKNEPKMDLRHRPEMMKLLLMLDGMRYRELFGREEDVKPILKPTEKASRSWKASVKLVGKDYVR
jgi:hypothetical protein